MQRKMLGGLALSLVVATCSHGMPSGARAFGLEDEPQITIRIHDYSRVQPTVLRQATQAAGDILREIGVMAVWIECGAEPEVRNADCDRPLTPTDFLVSLIPRSMSRRLRVRNGTLGLAAEPVGEGFGFFASIFYDDAEELAHRHQLEIGQLLATLITHEVGHLLLGTNSHSTRGLMSAFWSAGELRIADQRNLTFSTGEMRRIRVNLNRRRAAYEMVEMATRATAASLEQGFR